MATLSFESSVLEYQEPVSQGYYDDNGDYVQGSYSWIRYCRCDVVPTGKGEEITLPDGRKETYSYTVYNLPRDCREFKYGDAVRLTILGKTSVYSVKGFHRYQLQCKMWI